jgi:hypothetical protein
VAHQARADLASPTMETTMTLTTMAPHPLRMLSPRSEQWTVSWQTRVLSCELTLLTVQLMDFAQADPF